jgi:H+/Cl- antiporter ClcA
MSLQEALQWVFAGPGAGLLAYRLIAKIKWFETFEDGDKRVMSMIFTAAISIICYMIAWSMLYIENAPATAREWIAQLFTIALVAITTSQVTHGYKYLSMK